MPMKIFIISILIILVCFIPITAQAEYTAAPTQIIIPSVNILLPVHTAKIVFNTWEVHLDGASFGEGTQLPGNIGNTIIFSHARQNLFGNLPNIKKGDFIHVFTDYDWFVYQVNSLSVVSPQNIEVLENNNQYELTLYTCIGENYTKRFIVKAFLVSNPSLH